MERLLGEGARYIAQRAGLKSKAGATGITLGFVFGKKLLGCLAEFWIEFEHFLGA